MSIVQPGDSVKLQFVTEDQNHSAVAPIATPVATFVRNGADDGAVTVLVTPLAANLFEAFFTVPATYAISDQVQVRVSYVAGTRIALEIIWERTLSILPQVGVGADQVTITITDPQTLFPISDADVWVTTDQAGLNVIAGTLQSDSAGKVLFLLDAGTTYFLWMQKEGQKSIRGEEFVAVAD